MKQKLCHHWNILFCLNKYTEYFRDKISQLQNDKKPSFVGRIDSSMIMGEERHTMIKKNTGPFSTNGTIILASGSPRRRELLADLGLDFEVHPSKAEEPAPLSGEGAEEYAKRMAEMKTMDVAKHFIDKTVQIGRAHV